MRKFTSFLMVTLALLLAQVAIQAQTNGKITGTVTDQKGDLVAGATVVVSNAATKQEFTATTNDEGFFSIQAVPSGVYKAVVTAAGFKTANVTDIKVDVGLASSIKIPMEVGAASEQVTVVGGGEILRTENPTVGTTLTGRQITDIPTASRDALDLVLAMPGTTTPGRPRTSSVNGLPKGALNITLDGVNVQDNVLKSNDGFFTYVRPRTDAISEVTVSTSNPGAESSSEGAVQIKFATQNGTNQYHGEAYWYHRDPYFNANYWFNNRDVAPLPGFTTAPHAFIILNQFGGKVGGPISFPKLFDGKDKAFFFVNYEEYRLPERASRTRTILSPSAQAGIYRFFASAVPGGLTPATTCAPTGQTGSNAFLCSTNVFTLVAATGTDCDHITAGNQPCLTTPDPTVTALLGQIRGAVSGFQITPQANPNVEQVSFVNTGGQKRYFPTVRFDFNLTKNHHLENIWNYQYFTGLVDFLNNVDPAFPGFPNQGFQGSNRWSNTTGWRWNIKPNIVNDARFGLTGGTVLFFPNVNAGQFANQAGYNLGIGQAGITSATVTTAPSRRNAPVKQFTDSVSWVKGNHSFNFGGNFSRINFWNQGVTVVPSAAFVPSSTLDPNAFNAFASLGGQQGAAANLYYVLSGRLSAINGNARLSEETNKYTYLGDLISRGQMSEWGTYAQDAWKLRPNLTLNLGIRFERQLPYVALNNNYAYATIEDLYGESGLGNLFKPNPVGPSNINIVSGVCANCASDYTLYEKGSEAFKADNGTFAPSIGVAWSPNFGDGFMSKIFGSAGQTVFRGGFSIATVREGMNTFESIYAANPGGTLTANRNLTLGNLLPNTYLRQGPFTPPSFPSQPVYPNKGLITDAVNAFLPEMKIGRVESYTFGIQRELTSNMAIEFRYVGNRGKNLWRQYDLNEVNTVENGFYNEFLLARQNYIANMAAGRGNNFRYFGPGTNTSPLPIILGYFSGAVDPTVPGNYTSGNFASNTYLAFVNPLNPSATGFAANLAGTTFNNRRTCPTTATCTPLFPFNHFIVNPGKLGGSFVMSTDALSWYDAFQFEFRRRLSGGLLLQANYVFGKAQSNTYASSSAAFDQPASLRDLDGKKGVTPFDITHAVKANFIWEVPVGRGQALFGGVSNWVNQLIGGWGFNGNIRMQSGSPVQFGAVSLNGITAKELQDAVGIYRGEADADGVVRGNVYWLPFAIRQNTWKALNATINGSGAPTFTNGAPDASGQYIAGPNWNSGCIQAYGGQCGFANLVLKGPAFFRSDLSVVKKFRFTETTGLELRAEFLNAFNNINFLVGAAANDVNGSGAGNAATFARFTAAYQDLSTTNDPGGRLVQFVVRLKF